MLLIKVVCGPTHRLRLGKKKWHPRKPERGAGVVNSAPFQAFKAIYLSLGLSVVNTATQGHQQETEACSPTTLALSDQSAGLSQEWKSQGGNSQQCWDVQLLSAVGWPGWGSVPAFSKACCPGAKLGRGDTHPPELEALFPDLCLPRLDQGPGKMKPVNDWNLYIGGVCLVHTHQNPKERKSCEWTCACPHEAKPSSPKVLVTLTRLCLREMRARAQKPRWSPCSTTKGREEPPSWPLWMAGSPNTLLPITHQNTPVPSLTQATWSPSRGCHHAWESWVSFCSPPTRGVPWPVLPLLTWSLFVSPEH